MKTKRFARIQMGMVAELFATADDVAALFNPELVWVDITSRTEIAEGWLFDGSRFAAPATVIPPAAPSIADLQAQLRSLTAQVAALSGK